MHTQPGPIHFLVYYRTFPLLGPTLWSFAISKVTAQRDSDLPSPHLPYAQQSVHVWRWGPQKFNIPSLSDFCSFYMLAQPACFKISFQLAHFHYTEKENMVCNLWCLARCSSKQVPAEPINRKQNQMPACSTLTQSAIRMLKNFSTSLKKKKAKNVF